jgi:hypothetical protein
MASSSTRFLDHTKRRATVGRRTLLGRVIDSSQRPLPDNTQHTHNRQTSMPWWDSNPPSQQTSGLRPTP